ncbi:Ysc84 domain-containing protein [Fusarium falciforme]|uniref:Ysc84 domain-containing protein n=1 Tax=Fusarium falciforme TaxID=195108 RepID=UPI0023000CA9|nr:Ysc84 domain-containing protein [Fusarium falciforme]WAO85216.1 Ysc84 domain-containing protein [Fusarium falciforme]
MTATTTTRRKKLSISSIGGRGSAASGSGSSISISSSIKNGDKDTMKGGKGSGGGWSFGRWGVSAKNTSSTSSNSSSTHHLLPSQSQSQASASTQGPPSTQTQSVSVSVQVGSAAAATSKATAVSAAHAHYHPHAFRSHQHHQQHASSQAPPHPSAYNSALNKPAVSFASLSDSNSVCSVSSTSTTASTPTHGSPTTTTPVSSPASSTSSPTPRSTSTFATTVSSSSKPASKKTVHFRTTSSSNTTGTGSNTSSAPPIPILSVVPPPGQDGGDGEARRPAMQRVSSFLPSWDKRSSGSRQGLFGWSSNRSSTSISVANANSLTRINTAAANANGRVHREAFWPATLDRECEKAARILKSFCTDGYLVPLEEEEDESRSTTSEPLSPKRVTKKIPRRIIQNAAGIAIFTCMRSGLWMTGSGGSGILIARKSDGTWSPPSGIMLHTPTLSFIIGVDVYDCVLVVNNLAALESITKPRVTLGEDVGLTSGPLVSLDSDESHIRWKDLGNTVLTYMKSRGQTQAVNLNGCILAERGNENERFYASTLTQMDILAGNVARNVDETRPLFEIIKMAEGRTDYDAAITSKIAIECAPGDAVIASPKSSTPASPRTPFGIPSADDPDPFGVLALEMAGLEIREAGSRLRPTSSQFDFNPVPTSPAYSKFNRQSVDTFVTRSNRGSYMSSRTVKSQMTDAGTQTDVGKDTPETTPSPGQSEDGHDRASRAQIPDVTEEEEEIDYTKVDLTPIRHLSGNHTPASAISHSSTTAVEHDTLKVEPRDDTDKASSNYDSDRDDRSSRNADDENDSESDAEEEEDDEEEPVVFEVAAVQPARTQAVASRVIHAKGNMVTIPKRIPPPLPMRSPARTSRSSKSEIGDVTNLRSPLRHAFNEQDLKSDDEQPAKAQPSPFLKPMELKVEKVRYDEKKAEEFKPETPKIQEHSTDDRSSDSETEFFPAEEDKAVDNKIEITKTEEAQAEVSKTVDAKAATAVEAKPTQAETEAKTESRSIGTSPTIPQIEHSDNSDTVAKKHTSSVYTGATEDRWSFDGSSLTTPTSDRPYSVVDDITEDETPRKPTREVERIEVNEKHEELTKMGSKEATPNTITVA